MTAHILAICNQKGGVGKTTTTYHLARAAHLRGRRVLLIDNDPQGDLTTLTAAEPVEPDAVGLADVISASTDEQLRDTIVGTIWDGVDLVPTVGEALGVVRNELTIAGAGREARLRDALRDVASGYDLVFIDCPPSLDLLTINALTAADRLVVVTESKLLSSNGLGALLGTVAAVQQHYNPQLAIAGVIVNKHAGGTLSSAHWLNELTAAAGERAVRVLEPPMPAWVAVQDTSEAARGLDQWGDARAMQAASIYADYLTALEGATA